MAELVVRDLEVAAEDRRVLLRAQALDVRSGERIGVRGPSGAGKTVFLNALSGLVSAKGTLRWDDDALTSMSDARRAQFRRERVGLVFQDFLLFEEMSALDNATVASAFDPARASELRERAGALFERLKIAPLAERRAERLSGGERQRVAIARALVGQPEILLADEPTASLDRKAADALIDDFAALAAERGTTVVMVSHDVRALDAMDRIVDVRDGELDVL